MTRPKIFSKNNIRTWLPYSILAVVTLSLLVLISYFITTASSGNNNNNGQIRDDSNKSSDHGKKVILTDRINQIYDDILFQTKQPSDDQLKQFMNIMATDVNTVEEAGKKPLSDLKELYLHFKRVYDAISRNEQLPNKAEIKFSPEEEVSFQILKEKGVSCFGENLRSVPEESSNEPTSIEIDNPPAPKPSTQVTIPLSSYNIPSPSNIPFSDIPSSDIPLPNIVPSPSKTPEMPSNPTQFFGFNVFKPEPKPKEIPKPVEPSDQDKTLMEIPTKHSSEEEEENPFSLSNESEEKEEKDQSEEEQQQPKEEEQSNEKEQSTGGSKIFGITWRAPPKPLVKVPKRKIFRVNPPTTSNATSKPSSSGPIIKEQIMKPNTDILNPTTYNRFFQRRHESLSGPKSLISKSSSTTPPHSRLRHHSPTVKQRFQNREDLFDMLVLSTILDAGAGDDWKYKTLASSSGPASIKTRSEGIAQAVEDMYLNGVFGKCTANDLKKISIEDLSRGFQISENNPMNGVEGRLKLLFKLGQQLDSCPIFASNLRPSGLIKYITLHKINKVSQFWQEIIINGFAPIFPQRDVWPHSSLNLTVPFHKLLQWLAYTLIDLLSSCFDMNFEQDIFLTGLPEYRNGGLFIDCDVLVLKQQLSNPNTKSFLPSDDLVIEWRCATVILIDKLHLLLKKKYGDSLGLAQVLESGTWKAGREMAALLRPVTKSAPIPLVLDGTIF